MKNTNTVTFLGIKDGTFELSAVILIKDIRRTKRYNIEDDNGTNSRSAFIGK